jgi:hypothetical protein
MAANMLLGLGTRFIDPNSLAKIFIETIAAKAVDPSRWSDAAKKVRLRHIMLEAWEAANIVKVLRLDDVVAQAAAFLGVEVPKTPEYLKISAMDLLFGILKDTALDTWKPEELMLLAKSLNYAIYCRSDAFDDLVGLTLAMMVDHTIDELHESDHWSAWNVVIQVVLPLLHSKRTLLVDPFYARLVAQINLVDEASMQSQTKIEKESRTLLLSYQAQLKVEPTAQTAKTDQEDIAVVKARAKAKHIILKNIQNVLDYGVCIDNDDMLEATVARIIESIKSKVDFKGLFISGAKTLSTTENVLAFSTATAVELAFRNTPFLPGPVRWLGYSLCPVLFLSSRSAIMAAEAQIAAFRRPRRMLKIH